MLELATVTAYTRQSALAAGMPQIFCDATSKSGRTLRALHRDQVGEAYCTAARHHWLSPEFQTWYESVSQERAHKLYGKPLAQVATD